jgi:chitodextrinase
MPDGLEPMIKIGNVTPPQFLNEEGKWEVIRGAGGAYRMQVPVEVSDEPFSGTGNLTKEFTAEMTGLIISNDSEPGVSGAASLTFTIDGKTRIVKAGEVYEGRFRPFTVVTVNSTVPWRAEGLQTIGGVSIAVPTPDTTPPANVTNLTTSALTATGVTLTWTASASNDCVGYGIYRGPTLLATVTGTTYNATGLTQATQYTFTVKAKDAADNIATGTSTTITTSSSADTTPPANVTNLTTANITQTGLTLNWTASASGDVASYDVYNGSTFLANVTGITYNVNGLSASTAYTFWVKAKDASGNSATGTSVGATTSAPVADTTAPSNVTGLSTSSLTQTGVTLTWSAATDNVAVTGYEVYNGATLVTTVSALTYNVTGLTASTQYTFTVKARDAAGNVASGTSTTFTTSAVADTTSPVVSISPAAGTYTSAQSVTLTATDNSGGAVVIYYTTDGSTPTQSSAVFSAALSVPATSTIKYFGKDPSGNVSTVQTAVYTINIPDTTSPNPVTGLTAGTATSSSIPVNWTLSSSGDVVSQEVAYSSNGGSSYTVASAAVNASSTSYSVTGLTASTNYIIRVVAVDGAGNRSTAVTVTTSTGAAGVANLQLYLNSADLVGTTMPAGTDTSQGVVWADRSGKGRTVTITRQWNWTPANWSNFTTSTGLILDEINGSALPNFSELNSGIFTWEFCFQMSVATNDDYNFFTTDAPWFRHKQGSTGALNYQPGSGNYYLDQSLTARLSDGSRHHVMLIADGTNVTVYVDNIQVHTHAATSASQSWTNVKVVFGKNGNVLTNKMTVVRYYDKALNSTERTANFNECMA